METLVDWNIQKIFSLEQDVKNSTIKNHFKHTWYGFHWSFLQSKVNHPCVFWFESMAFFFCRYPCGYGLKDHLGNRNHMRSIEHGHLAHFSIKRITTLTSHDLIMEIMQNLFIHDLYVSHINIMHWKHNFTHRFIGRCEICVTFIHS